MPVSHYFLFVFLLRLYSILKSGNVSPPILFFSEFFWLSLPSEISLPISTENSCWDFEKDYMESIDTLERIATLMMLHPPKHEHRSLCSLRCTQVSLGSGPVSVSWESHTHSRSIRQAQGLGLPHTHTHCKVLSG